jgi:hypothetical protein
MATASHGNRMASQWIMPETYYNQNEQGMFSETENKVQSALSQTGEQILEKNTSTNLHPW